MSKILVLGYFKIKWIQWYLLLYFKINLYTLNSKLVNVVVP